MILPPAALPQVGQVTPPRSFYRVQRVLDVTGDGRPDTLALEAFGTKPYSLDFVFSIRSHGREIFHDAWNNRDQFTDYGPAELNDRVAVARVVRSGMATFFESKAFEPIALQDSIVNWTPTASAECDGNALDCVTFYLRFEKDTAARVARGLPATPETGPPYGEFIKAIDASPFDTALVRHIRADWRTSKALTFTYSHGYETTRTIAWSGVAHRFFPVFECC